MTIHSEHPFLPPDSERSPLRRLRGRLTSPVTAWTAVRPGRRPVGLTVSSVLVADGEPGRVLGLVDPDSDVYPAMLASGSVAVSLLGPQHRHLADALAGTAPAPGGPFTLGRWTDTEWGPVPADSPGWVGAVLDGDPEEVGWSMLVRARVAHVQIGTGDEVLTVFRGRYSAG